MEEAVMRLLAVSAHTADFCSRAGGTIALHAKTSAAVKVVTLTYGERSESGGLYAGGARPALDAVKTARRDEAERAAALKCFTRAQGSLPAWYTDVAKLRAFQARQLSGRSAILYAEAFERTVLWVGDRLPLDSHIAG
jgi:hypothetical protein